MLANFMDKDITIHTIHGASHRGVLVELVDGKVIKLQVGIDELYIDVDSFYAVTEHGIQRTDFADLAQ